MQNFEFSNVWNPYQSYSWTEKQMSGFRPRDPNFMANRRNLSGRDFSKVFGVGGARRRAAIALGKIARASRPLSKTFNLMGKNVTYGRAGLAGGLGLLALRNGANVMDRMRYGDYSGAMMSGAMTAAAGYGAYATYMYKGALRQHFNNAAAWILKRFSR